MELSTIIKKTNEVSIHMNTTESGYITNIENGDVFEINDTTRAILELCMGQNTLDDIFKQLKQTATHNEFEVTEQDVLNLAEFFGKWNLYVSLNKAKDTSVVFISNGRCFHFYKLIITFDFNSKTIWS